MNYTEQLNEETGELEVAVEATIQSLDDSAETLMTNKNKTPYRWVPVTFALADGGTQTLTAILYENSRLKHIDKFKAGSNVTVMVGLESRLGKIQLGNSKFDLTAIFGDKAKGAIASKPKVEEAEEIQAEA